MHIRTLLLAVLLLALAVVGRSEEVDPEPPPGKWIFRKINGIWKQVATRQSGAQHPASPSSYVTFRFDGDGRGTYEMKNGLSYDVTLEVDKKRRDVIYVTYRYKNGRAHGLPASFFFKLEQSNLYLAYAPRNNPKAKADYSGSRFDNTVLIFERVKK